jgi:transcriptional repressor NrdR
MKCPFCGHDSTHVIDSRVSEDGDAIRRRRRCDVCEKRFTTYERSELVWPVVVKKDGSRVEYNRQKIHDSMRLALRKRPVSVEAIDDAVHHIEEQLLNSGAKEIHSARLGEFVMSELKRLDQVAYIRFASVYRCFEDVGAFLNVLEEFKPS